MLRLTEENTLLAFTVFGGWFGPPPARYESTLIDGRIRSQVCLSLGARAPKAVTLRRPEEVVRWLVVAGHIQRAHEYCGRFGFEVDELLAVRVGLPDYVVASLHVEQKRTRSRNRPDRGRSQWRRAVALARTAVEENRLIEPEELLAGYEEVR
ncbi:MAG: hypothetical protein A2V70_01300 [Planctomycetes bacterium RBG_13_63_9]|nr:MAG: hypothetical protein A2V70_01300 [Planctomycetes bacterium RBG_13_63_9]